MIYLKMVLYGGPPFGRFFCINQIDSISTAFVGDMKYYRKNIYLFKDNSYINIKRLKKSVQQFHN